MSATNTSSLFAPIALAPRDPILGITEAFNADPNPNRINLGVGVYVGDDGRVPLLDCVKRAETLLLEGNQPLTYLPIDGLQAYDKAASSLVFGADSPVIAEGRVIAVQTLGGTGGLRLGADLLRGVTPARSKAAVTSSPTPRTAFTALPPAFSAAPPPTPPTTLPMTRAAA